MQNTKKGTHPIQVKTFENPQEGAAYLAKRIADLINEKRDEGEKCVLGMATGSTPEPLYKELIRLHKEQGLSFVNVITYNLDEYFPITSDSNQSYHYYMHRQLFDHVDIKRENVHVPNGDLPKEEVEAYCRSYEEQIEKAGGIDLQILGIGHNGHIGFNEPGSDENTRTRLIDLDERTREANARNFGDINEVPTQAITMGIHTILKAKEIYLMAWGDAKAPAVKNSVKGKATKDVPASLLQFHQNCTFVLDKGAAKELN